MLGRHVYRVRPLERGGWDVEKEGAGALSRHRSRDAAAAAAERLAAADEPSRLVVEDESGALVAERLFGEDAAATLDRNKRG